MFFSLCLNILMSESPAIKHNEMIHVQIRIKGKHDTVNLVLL